MMSTRVARPAPSDGASTVLDRLAPADLAIAELKALVGEGLTKTAFFEVVRACGIASPDHKAWTTQKINESVARLAARGVLSTDGVAEDSWRAALTSRVALAPTGPALARRVRDAAPKSWREGGAYQYYHGLSRPPYFDADLARAARLMALAGDEAQVERLIAVAEREATQDGYPMSMAPALLRGLPADPAFLVKPAPGLRDRIRSAWIEMLLDDGRLEPGLAAQIAAASGENVDWTSAPRFDLAMMRLDLMGERPDAARIRIARLRDSAPVMALAGQATLAFLGGTPGGGVALFREALKQHRKALGKRRIVLPGEFALYHLMALFAANDVATHGEIGNLLETLEGTRPYVAVALASLLDLVSGREREAKDRAERLAKADIARREGTDPLGVAISTLALAVVEGANAPRRHLADLGAVRRWGGHVDLAERILAQVHAKFPASGRPGDGEWPATLRALGDGYPRQFLDIVPIRAAWERTLDKLEGFLAPPASLAKIAPLNQTRRLVFRLDAVTSEITVLEQAAKGAGWSAGRPVALKRLHQRDPKLDYLTPEDIKVAQTLRFHRSYYGDSYDFDPVKGPLALVGHPRLFDATAPDQPVELVRYPAELVVREDRARITIDLSHRARSPQVFVEPETPGRWRLI